MKENSEPVTIVLSATDVDNSAEELTIQLTSLPAENLGALKTTNGESLSIGSSISYPWELVFEPAADQYGETSFTFVAFDGELHSANATHTIEIGFVNDLPIAFTTPLVVARYFTFLQFFFTKDYH